MFPTGGFDTKMRGCGFIYIELIHCQFKATFFFVAVMQDKIKQVKGPQVVKPRSSILTPVGTASIGVKITGNGHHK